MTTPLNPYIAGNPVDPANFFNRRQPLRRVVGRLLSGGQSTAVIGEPRLGKTSFLHYLAAREKRAELYGEQGEWLRAQELDHLLTKKEREQLHQVVRGAAQLLGHGAATLIEAFAKGLGESLASGE